MGGMGRVKEQAGRFVVLKVSPGVALCSPKDLFEVAPVAGEQRLIPHPPPRTGKVPATGGSSDRLQRPKRPTRAMRFENALN